MRKIFPTVAIFIVAIALVACSSQPAAVTGTKVNVAGGSYTNVAPPQLKQMRAAKDLVLINVHIPYAGEIVKTDAFIPYNEIQQNITKFPSDKTAKIFLYCQSGRMSAIAAEELLNRGYTNIWNLDGGMFAWGSTGLPVIRK